ncbi:hypothetical protein FB451DRAFT_642888 [Mycena latifolia]|nr:hypothetical protein FB451DRAFT_642888 [Mycena latifolia]
MSAYSSEASLKGFPLSASQRRTFFLLWPRLRGVSARARAPARISSVYLLPSWCATSSSPRHRTPSDFYVRAHCNTSRAGNLLHSKDPHPADPTRSLGCGAPSPSLRSGAGGHSKYLHVTSSSARLPSPPVYVRYTFEGPYYLSFPDSIDPGTSR